MLALQPELITKDVMMNALSTLKQAKVVPEWQPENSVRIIQDAVNVYAAKPEQIKAIMPEVALCMSKLCWYICRAIRIESATITAKDLEIIKSH